MKQKKLLCVISIVGLILFLLIILLMRQPFVLNKSAILQTYPKPSQLLFPLLNEKIAKTLLQIEELDNAQTRAYIFHGKLLEPLFQTNNLVKGVMTISGDSNQTPIYFALGSPNTSAYFGRKKNNTAKWQEESIKNIVLLTHAQQQVFVYLSFPKKKK